MGESNISLTNSILTSKNNIISELNSRIIIFENDKILLKQTLDDVKTSIENDINQRKNLEYDLLSSQNLINEYKNNITILQNKLNYTIYNNSNIIHNKTMTILLLKEQIKTLQSLFTNTIDEKLHNITTTQINKQQLEKEKQQQILEIQKEKDRIKIVEYENNI